MTDAEREALIKIMRGEIAKRWGAWRQTRKTYEKSNIIDQKRFDACARAALAVAEAPIRSDALREFERNSKPQSYGPVLDGTP
jgi:hypothetical protein